MWYDEIECAAIKGQNNRLKKNSGSQLEEYYEKENQKTIKRYEKFKEDLKYRGKPFKSLIRFLLKPFS